MDIRSIISKIEEIEAKPSVGDVVYLEFGNTLEVETTIVEINGDDIVLEADAKLESLLEDLNTIEKRKINESKKYDDSHNGPYDRGRADSYYGRKPIPHKWVDNADGTRTKVQLTDPEEIEAYKTGYRDNDDRKDYGESIDEAGIMDKIKGVFGKKPDAAPKAAAPQAEKRPGNYSGELNGTKLASLLGHKKSNDIGDRLSKKAASKVVAQFPDGNFYDITLSQGQFRVSPSKQSEEGWYGYAIQKQGNAQVRAPSKNFNAQSLGEDVNEAVPNKAQALVELEEIIEEMETKLEREVEWAMTDHYDPKTVQKLLAPINQSLDNLKRFFVQQQSETELGEGDVVAFKRPELKGDAPNLGRAKELARELYWRETSSWNTPEELKAEENLKNQLAKIGFSAETDFDLEDGENIVLTHKASGKQYPITGDDLHVESSVYEAEYQGRNVPLGKPMKGDVKKSKVYVKGPKGNVVKVNFGDKKMRIKKSNPKRRKSFRARHNCSNPGPRWKARYWSCRAW